ncbi:MAG: sugar phosphate isomerase/epimerase [Armatimonadetes bacterium]|nr:sugar phosphate isomerase/epimerase [Armatimonadota bacterium]
MKIGLDSYSFRYAAGIWGWRAETCLTPEGYLRVAGELGLAGVHFADLRHFESLEPSFLTELRREAEAAGLYIELGTGGTDPGHLGEALHAAQTLGSPVLRTFVGGFRWHSEITGADLVAQATENLREVVPVAEQLGVRIAIENHLDLTTDELLDLLRAVGSDYLGVCLDTGNGLGLLEDPVAVAEALAPYTFTTHLKEFRVILRREGLVLRGAPLGQGDVPNGDIVPLLRQLNPMGDALALNVETALERVTIPVFAPSFSDRLANLRPRDLLRLVSHMDFDHSVTADQLALPEERGASAEEVLAAERAQVAESAAWARRQFA